MPSEAFLGGGSAPVQPIPTAAVARVAAVSLRLTAPKRPGPGPCGWVIRRWSRRVQKGVVLFDLRTVPEATSRDFSTRSASVCHDRGHRSEYDVTAECPAASLP